MADSGPTKGEEINGVRRRHSGHHNEDARMVDSQYDGIQTGTHTLSLPATAASNEPRTHASGSDAPSSSIRAATDPCEYVQSSLDDPRLAALVKSKKRKSDEIARDRDISSFGDGNLTLDTGTSSDSGILGRGIGLSPPGLTMPTSDFKSRTSPTTPTGRNPGMSLRSSLFSRNMKAQAQNIGPVVEMDHLVSSNSEGVERVMSISGHSKKASEPTVVVSPVYERDYTPPLALPSRKGVEGVSALPHYHEWIEKRARHNAWWKRTKAAYSEATKFVLRINDVPPSQDGRHVELDPSRKQPLIDERTGKVYINNNIRSSRYTAYNFLPRQLFFQFSKLANFYFLSVSILQMIPGLSTTGTYTTIIPLLVFVSISMAKEGFDDFRRYRLDKEENNKVVSGVLHAYRPVTNPIPGSQETTSPLEGPVHWAPVKWHSLQVGDVVKLERDEAAPADLVLLQSKGQNGIAYVETMALDGETNLKAKQAASPVAKLCTSPVAIAANKAHFVAEDPNLNLYNFDGKVTIDGETAPLTNNEIIYRGSVLRNTPEAYGMVMFSGEECKIRMNANKNPRIKAPSLQAVVNRIVVLVVCFVVFLALYMTIAYQVWHVEVEEKSWYLTDAYVPFHQILVSFIIMFNTMIPLSLYVSLEIIKVAQMFLLNDIDMYDEVSDTPFEARTSTINEELGQISYIFSDKTGTLTDNIMKFRKLSVAGTAWLHDIDLKQQERSEEPLRHKKRNENKGKRPLRKARFSSSQDVASYTLLDGAVADNIHQEPAPRVSTSQWQSSARPGKAQLEMSTTDMISYIKRRPHTVFAKKAKMLIISMAVCHTCLPERNGNDDHVEFQASSPDELALVQAAQELGYIVWNRDAGTLTLRTLPNGPLGEPSDEMYQVLDTIEFSSKRKRMSVVVRFPDGRVCIICKGADSVVVDRLRLATLANEKVVEIEKRVSTRKSMEAQQALHRKSEQVERCGSVRHSTLSRISVDLGRPSISGLGRSSIASPRLGTIRDDVDTWLGERERDVDASRMEDASMHYSPRPSAQIARKSVAHSDGRSSFQHDSYDEELVEEALVLNEEAVIERTFQHINDFASEGLRTLLYAYRFLDEESYGGWKKVYHGATTSIVNRQELIERAGEMIEQDLELGGSTAIEDKLQHLVPETIDKLRRANIKMWMLTGDKRETAINIGHSCRLIKDYSSVTILDYESSEVEKRIAAAIVDINGGAVAHSVVVIDGQTLGMIDTDAALHALFIDLAVLADSVICCRASPSQKAGLVKAIRRRVKKSITLAIGDGANDIAMIQEAHVGIGITGKEGLQAARTSDYSIAQFSFLTKLLLVHGRWSYIRVCKYTVGTFWKEMMFFLTQALYQRWAGYTGTSLYESWSLSFFNTLFTSLPVIFLGIFEKDLLPSTLIAVPELYTKGQHNGGFNLRVYLSWMFMAASEAMIIFFTMKGLYGEALFTRDNALFAMGDLAFTACIIVIVTKMQILEQHSKTYMAAIAFILSVGGWFLWNIFLSASYKSNNEYNVKGGFLVRFGKDALWWLTLILIVGACCLYEIAVRSLKAAFFPTDVEVFQALEKDVGIRKRFEEGAASELQAGWHHGSKKSSLERLRDAEAQAKREGEVEDLLNRPRV